MTATPSNQEEEGFLKKILKALKKFGQSIFRSKSKITAPVSEKKLLTTPEEEKILTSYTISNN
jgi:hypothetical protein